MRYKRSGFFSYLSAFHLHNRKLLASEYTDCECFSHFIFLSLPLQFFSSFSGCPICAEGDSTLTISNTVKGTKYLPIDHQRLCLSDLNFFWPYIWRWFPNYRICLNDESGKEEIKKGDTKKLLLGRRENN